MSMKQNHAVYCKAEKKINFLKSIQVCWIFTHRTPIALINIKCLIFIGQFTKS